MLSQIYFLLVLPLWVLASAVDIGLTADQLQYVENDPKVTHIVLFDIATMPAQGKEGDAVPLGTLQLGLFGELLPFTTKNFVAKATDPHGGYLNSIFHRIVKGFIVQGGNLSRKSDGLFTSLDFTRFNDENFDLKHDKLGRLSMANLGPNTNGCQYFITTGKDFPHLDGKHVVFGQLVLGFDTLLKMDVVECDGDKPIPDVVIVKATVADLSVPVALQLESVSLGYLFFMFFCVLAVVCYGLHWYNTRRLFVDLASLKM